MSNVGGSPTADHHYAYITPEEGVIIGTTIVVISVFTLMASCNLKKTIISEQSLEDYIGQKKEFTDREKELDFLYNQDLAADFLRDIRKDFLSYGKTNFADAQHSWNMLRKPKGFHADPQKLEEFLNNITLAERK